MKTSNPLDLLIENSRKARDNAGRSLAQALQGEQLARQQLAGLKSYRSEYDAKLHAALNEGMDISLLDNYRRFIRALETAINKAEHKLADHGQIVGNNREQWRQKQKTLTSFDTLASRRAARAQAVEARHEQRRGDEFNTNMQARKLAHALRHEP